MAIELNGCCIYFQATRGRWSEKLILIIGGSVYSANCRFLADYMVVGGEGKRLLDWRVSVCFCDRCSEKLTLTVGVSICFVNCRCLCNYNFVSTRQSWSRLFLSVILILCQIVPHGLIKLLSRFIGKFSEEYLQNVNLRFNNTVVTFTVALCCEVF